MWNKKGKFFAVNVDSHISVEKLVIFQILSGYYYFFLSEHQNRYVLSSSAEFEKNPLVWLCERSCQNKLIMEECSLEHLYTVINVSKNLIADYCTLQGLHLILPIWTDIS